MTLSLINIFAFALMLAFNVFSNSGMLGGNTTGQISAQYTNLLTPAGWTFSIWGVIYMLVAVFVITSFFNETARRMTGSIGNWFWISCLFNILWIVTWHSNLIWLSMVMMTGLLVSLISISIKIFGYGLNIHSAGFSVYLGWITVAFLANLTVMAVSLGMNGLGNTSQVWTTAILPLAALIMAAVVFFRVDWIYGLTGIAAYTGIIYRQISASGLGAKYPGVLTASIVGIVLIAISTVFVIYNTKAIRLAMNRV